MHAPAVKSWNKTRSEDKTCAYGPTLTKSGTRPLPWDISCMSLHSLDLLEQCRRRGQCHLLFPKIFKATKSRGTWAPIVMDKVDGDLIDARNLILGGIARFPTARGGREVSLKLLLFRNSGHFWVSTLVLWLRQGGGFERKLKWPACCKLCSMKAVSR